MFPITDFNYSNNCANTRNVGTIIILIRAIPEKIPGGGGGGGGGGGEETAGDIFLYGWLVGKDFKLYGSLVSDKIKLHGWYFAAWKGRKKYYLPKKERSFIKSSRKKALSLANRSGNGHFCLHAIVKPRMFLSNIGKNGPEMKKVNKQCLLDTPRTVRVSEKTWQVIVQTRRP